MIRDININEVSKAMECGLLNTGTGLNQEQCLQRPGDTRWSSHYKSLRSLVNLFQTIIKVLEYVEKEDKDGKARGILVYFQSFEFVFYLHLMLTILTITNTLSTALQRKDQDIVNAVNCVRSTRNHLDRARREEWEKVLDEVYEFCDKHDISKLEMDEAYIDPTKPRKKTGITNKHHFQVDCFNEILDWLLQDSLISLAKLYPNDFDHVELRDLNAELFLYIDDVRGDDRFANIHTIVELSQKMVTTRKHLTYSLVNRLLKLVLVLPVATTTVERIFSAMKTVKTKLRNRMGDDYMNHCLICNVEKEKML